jgi:hypothetical protein
VALEDEVPGEVGERATVNGYPRWAAACGISLRAVWPRR